jgi:hypothetical protein
MEVNRVSFTSRPFYPAEKAHCGWLGSVVEARGGLEVVMKGSISVSARTLTPVIHAVINYLKTSIHACVIIVIFI